MINTVAKSFLTEFTYGSRIFLGEFTTLLLAKFTISLIRGLHIPNSR